MKKFRHVLSATFIFIFLFSLVMAPAAPAAPEDGSSAGADTDPPVITLIGSPRIELHKGSTYVEQGAAAYDVVDGDLSDKIEISGAVDVDMVRRYTVTYTVTDSAGNKTTAERLVRIIPPRLVAEREQYLFFGTLDRSNPRATQSITAEEVGNITVVVTLSENTYINLENGATEYTKFGVLLSDSSGVALNAMESVYASSSLALSELLPAAGEYKLEFSMGSGGGESLDYWVTVQMPETEVEYFDEEEIPLAELPDTGGVSNVWLFLAGLVALVIGTALSPHAKE